MKVAAILQKNGRFFSHQLLPTYFCVILYGIYGFVRPFLAEKSLASQKWRRKEVYYE